MSFNLQLRMTGYLLQSLWTQGIKELSKHSGMQKTHVKRIRMSMDVSFVEISWKCRGLSSLAREAQRVKSLFRIWKLLVQTPLCARPGLRAQQLLSSKSRVNRVINIGLAKPWHSGPELVLRRPRNKYKKRRRKVKFL